MIPLTYRGEGFEELRRKLDPKLLDKALNTAMQRTAMKVRTHISKDVRKKYNVKAGAIGKAVRISKVKSRHGGRLIAYTGKAIGLDKFGAKEKTVKSARGQRRGATVQVLKGRGSRNMVRGGFLAPGKNGNGPFLFRRIDKHDNKSKIARRLGPAIPQMVSNKLTVVGVNETIGQAMPIEFARAMDHFYRFKR